MSLTKRQGNILESVVSEYIRIAQPISSQWLENRFSFDVSPATIRNELQVLSEEGYLAQPHTSAGRVPTDRGYRFFVDGVSKKEKVQVSKKWPCFAPASSLRLRSGLRRASKASAGKQDVFEKGVTDALEFSAYAARALANESSGLAAMYMESASLFFKEGWEDMLQEPEFEDQDSIRSFTKFLNDFEEHVAAMSWEDEVQVFIGKENPFSKVTDFSIMIAEFDFPGRGRGLVALLGPKRMAYSKNIHLLNTFSRIWKNK